MNQKIVIVIMVVLVISCLLVGAGRGKAVKNRNRRNTSYPQERSERSDELRKKHFQKQPKKFPGDADGVKFYQPYGVMIGDFAYDANDEGEDAVSPYDDRDEGAKWYYGKTN